jgi:hypothetical protein
MSDIGWYATGCHLSAGTHWLVSGFWLSNKADMDIYVHVGVCTYAFISDG